MHVVLADFSQNSTHDHELLAAQGDPTKIMRFPKSTYSFKARSIPGVFQKSKSFTPHQIEITHFIGRMLPKALIKLNSIVYTGQWLPALIQPNCEANLHFFAFEKFFWFFKSASANTASSAAPTDSTVSEDARMEPRTVATSTLSVGRSDHSASSHLYSCTVKQG